MDSTDSRTLRIEIPPCIVSSADGMNYNDFSGANGWNSLPASPNVLFWEGTIDLSGYVREMKTFYPLAGLIQEGLNWNAFGGSGQSVLTVVSSIPLDPTNVTASFLAGAGPGFIDLNILATGPSQQNYETVIFQETRLNLINNQLPALGICQTISQKQSGSLSPTASDTLFVLKVVVPTVLDNMIGTSLEIPASRVILPGKFGTEPDVEYMMRLKRSVELSQQV